MRTITSDNPQITSPGAAQEAPSYAGPTFSTKLRDGREIVIREMKGSDLLYMEEELSKFGETKKSFYLIERLNVGAEKITFEEIADLTMKDIKAISELISKANGTDEDDEDSPK